MITMAGVLACSTALAAPTPSAEPTPSYALTGTLQLGPPDHWDFLAYDDETQRVFIAHGTEVTVVSTSTVRTSKPHTADLKIVGHVTGLDNAHGVVLIPGGEGLAASGKSGAIVAFDQTTLKTIRTIRTGAGPDALVYDPYSQHAFAMNRDAGTITVINAQANTVEATIATGGVLEAGAADGQGSLYVNQTDTGSLLRIDTAKNTVTGVWKLPGCERPHGLAMDQWNHRVFISCENGKLLVVSGVTGKVNTQVAIGHGSDAVVYDAERHLVFSSNGDGTLSMLDAVSLQGLGSIATAPGARTMAVDPVSGRVFLVTADVDAAPALPTQLSFKPGTVKLLVFSPAS